MNLELVVCVQFVKTKLEDVKIPNKKKSKTI